mmetsp:Transcript_30106/g.82731  ORF Transcript_30106/g.82731 Transcript_30106/m.82731 type:complete len:821 (+) Transcript_30106:62-2524(+)
MKAASIRVLCLVGLSRLSTALCILGWPALAIRETKKQSSNPAGAFLTSLQATDSDVDASGAGGGEATSAKADTPRRLLQEMSQVIRLSKSIDIPPQQSFSKKASGTFFNVLFALVFACFFGYGIYVSLFVYRKFTEIHNRGDDRTLQKFAFYRFTYWFVWTENSGFRMLFLAAAFFTLAGSAAYGVIAKTNVVSSTYQILVWLIAPDAGILQRTKAGAFAGVVVSLVGLSLFALLMTMVQNAFERFLQALSSGYAPVIESGHIVIIGFTRDTITLVREVALAFAPDGGIVIVIMSETPKPDVEAQIRASKINLHGSSVVVRRGEAHNLDDLQHVSVDLCRTVILMPDRCVGKELRDATMIQTLISICGKDWPCNGDVLVVCSLQRNYPLFRKLGGERAKIVMLDHLVGKLLVTCSRDVGLGAAISQILSFEGSEFYISCVPETFLGSVWYEAALYYPECVLVGIISIGEDGASTCNLRPCHDYRLVKGDKLVLLAEDQRSIRRAAAPMCPSLTVSAARGREDLPTPRHVEHLLFIGWNDNIGIMLLEIDAHVARGSQVVILSEQSEEEREKYLRVVLARFGKKFYNITSIKQVEGRVCSRFQLEELPIKVQNMSRIFVLGDQDGDAKSASSDARTICATMQVRELLAESRVKDVPIISEFKDMKLERLCHDVKVSDFVDSSGIPAQLLAMTAYDPSILPVLFAILDPLEMQLQIRSLQDYFPVGEPIPTSLSFIDAMSIAHNSDEVLLGWSSADVVESCVRLTDSNGAMDNFDDRMIAISRLISSWDSHRPWALNPRDKSTPRVWDCKNDKLLVFGVLGR